MLIGVFLRMFKSYNDQVYIPFSSSDNFNGIIGKNGIGKSAVLQSLDHFFNSSDFIRHYSSNKKGLTNPQNIPYVTPLFLIKKEDVDKHKIDKGYLENLSDSIWNITGSKDSAYGTLYSQVEELKKIYDSVDYYLLACVEHEARGLSDEHNEMFFPQKNIFNDASEIVDSFNKVNLKLKKFLKDYYKYIYLPVEIDETDFTKIEKDEMQILMQQNLNKDISTAIKATQTCKEINKKLNSYLEKLHESLENYEYRSNTKYKQFNKTMLINSIIDGYFKTKELTFIGDKEKRDHRSVKNLSAGEKRVALLHLIEKLTESKPKDFNLILGIDEPESSLHMDMCYEQFERIKNISHNVQTIITTHWYGFIPLIDKGHVLSISNNNNDLSLVSIDLMDSFKSIKDNSRFIFDVKIKSTSDLVHSIISNINSDNPYKWIICEGYTDKVYLDTFLDESLKRSESVKVLALSGKSKVELIYKNILNHLNLEKCSVNGKVIFLIDSDSTVRTNRDDLEIPNAMISNHILFKRICIDDDGVVKFIDVFSKEETLVNPTVIEDLIPIEYFYGWLENMDFNDVDLDNVGIREKAAGILGYHWDFTQDQSKKIKDFINGNSGLHKTLLADFIKDKYEFDKDIKWISDLEDIIKK